MSDTQTQILCAFTITLCMAHLWIVGLKVSHTCYKFIRYCVLYWVSFIERCLLGGSHLQQLLSFCVVFLSFVNFLLAVFSPLKLCVFNEWQKVWLTGIFLIPPFVCVRTFCCCVWRYKVPRKQHCLITATVSRLLAISPASTDLLPGERPEATLKPETHQKLKTCRAKKNRHYVSLLQRTLSGADHRP